MTETIQRAARVFISCGQATLAERETASEVAEWFEGAGFKAYVAIRAQSLADVNSGIIGELKRADYYVFIDFRRERLVPSQGFINPFKRYPFRGSLFTNQELAIAAMLPFEYVIFLQQEGIRRDGLLQYMGSNAQRFASLDEVLPMVKNLVTERRWHPPYTRHLELTRGYWRPACVYGDITGEMREVRPFHIEVHNRRPELDAMSAVARLESLRHPDGTIQRDMDHSPLKVTFQQGFSQVIWRESHGTWDALSVSRKEPPKIFLNSALDVNPREPIITATGDYGLMYEAFAESFPVLRFGINLSVSEDPLQTSADLAEVPEA